MVGRPRPVVRRSDCDNGYGEVVQVADGNSGVAVSAASVRARVLRVRAAARSEAAVWMELRYVGHGVVNGSSAGPRRRLLRLHRAVKVATTFATVAQMSATIYTLTLENWVTFWMTLSNIHIRFDVSCLVWYFLHEAALRELYASVAHGWDLFVRLKIRPRRMLVLRNSFPGRSESEMDSSVM